MTDACNIQVAIRVRQLIEKELQNGLRSHWSIKDNAIFCDEADHNGKKVAPYIFDQIFDEQSVTMDVFEDLCKPIVGSALEGFNGTIFCYGQSSSGKTFTMSGTKMQPGVVRLSVEEIFNIISSIEHKEFLIRVGYMEIYNEQLTDLLRTEETVLKLREDADHNIIISGLKEEMVNSLDQVVSVIKRGDANRHTAATKQNDRSSRSHCILRIVIESKVDTAGDDEPINMSHLYFVDLAGSEKAGENSGDRFKEGCAINKSLFALGNVIRKLSGDENLQHVTTRDSKLTRLLQNALGGNSKTAIICTITPASVAESDSTLKFASRAKVIKNKPEVNEVVSDAAMLKRYRNQIKQMERKMQELSNTDMHMEKAELEKKLKEKEEVSQNQAHLIQNLQKMIVISGVEVGGNAQEVSRKRRRETWCPGKAARGLNKEKPFLPILDDIPSPPPKKRSAEFKSSKTESSVAFRPSKTLPLAPPPDMDTSLQLLDNVPAYSTNVNPLEDTINNNPYIKQLFDLEDRHERLREEHERTKAELQELQEFTELERQCEKETIDSLKKELKQMSDMQSSVVWMEEELMKTQQERNRLRSEVETKNRQLTAVEDGSGLTERNKQLTDAETKVISLNSEMDVQKARYEFHIAQMKTKLEMYTNLLEEQGVSPELIKQRMGSDSQVPNDIDELKIKHEQEITDLQNEVDSYVQKLEAEQRNQVEIIEHYEAKIEKQDERYKRDIKDIEDEKEVFRKMFEEEMAKTGENTPAGSSDEINSLKMKYEDEIQTLKTELQKCVELLEIEKQRSEQQRESGHDSQIECLKETHEKEMNELKKEVAKYTELLEVERTESEKLSNKNGIITDMDSLKQSHESEVSELQEELKKYIDLLATEKQKVQDLEEQTENQRTDHPSDIELLKEKYQEEIDVLKAENDKYVELLYSEREKNGGVENETELEIETLKQAHEVEVQNLKDKLDECEVVLAAERLKFKDASEKLSNTENESSPKNEDAENNAKSEIKALKQSHEIEVQRLQNKIDEYEESVVEERLKVEDLKKELDSYICEKSLEMEKIKQKYDEELGKVRTELKHYGERNDVKNTVSNESSDYEKSIDTDTETIRQKYEAEINELRNELDQYKELVDADEGCVKANQGMDMNSELFKAEYEQKLKDIEEDLEMYKDLLIEEQKKNSRNSVMEIENDLTVDNFRDFTGLDNSKGNMDLQSELLKAQSEKVDKAEHDDLQSELLASEMENLRQKYETEIESLREELERYKELLEQEKQNNKNEENGDNSEIVDESQSAGIDTSLEALKGEMQKLRQLLEDAEHRYSRLEEEKRDEKHSFEQQRQVYETTIKDAEDELHNFHSEIQKLSTEMENYQKAYKSLKEDKISLLNEKCDLEQKVDELEMKTQSSESDSESLEVMKKLRDEKETLERKLEAEILSLNEMKTELEEKCEDLSTEAEKEKLERQNLEEINQRLQHENEESERKVQECTCEIDRIGKIKSELEEKCSELSSEVENQKSENEKHKELNERLQHERNETYEKLEELKIEIDRMTMINSEVEAECLELRSETENLKLETDRLNELNTKLQQEKYESDGHKAEVGSEIEKYQIQKSDMEKRTQELTASVERLEKLTAALREENEMVIHEKGEIRGELEALETVNSGLKEELEKFAAKVESLEADSGSLKEENLLIKEETERKIEVYEETLQELKADLNVIEEENLTLRNTLAQRSDEVSDTNSEITQLKTHVNELEEDAKVSAELIGEYDNEVKQLKDKLETLEAWKREDSERVRIDWQEKFDKCVTERDNLAERLSAIENGFREELESSKQKYDETVSDLRGKNEGLEGELVQLREKLVVSETEIASLKKELKIINVSKDIVEDTKGRLSAAEMEKNKLVKMISELRDERASSRDGEAREVADLAERLRSSESEVEKLQERIEKLAAEKMSAEKIAKEFEEEKTSIEEDLYQAVRNRPQNSLRINIVESNKEFEEKWEQFVKDEKRKRVGLMRELREMKIELNKETTCKENAVAEAMKRVQVEVRNSKAYKELNELYKKADDDANILNTELEDEKAKSKRLETRLTDVEKVKEELQKKISDLEKNAKTSTGPGNGLGFIEGSHNCDFRLEMNILKRKLKESEDCIQKRAKDFQDFEQRQERYVASLKNEIRRLQSLDTTLPVGQLDFSGGAGSSTKKSKADVSNSSMPDVSGCGSSSSGGIIDHFKVVVTETENKRLKKENQKQAEKIEKQKARLEKLEGLEKENMTLKDQLEKAASLKKKLEEKASQNSEPRHALEGVQPKADSSGECIFRPDPPAKHISKLKFEIPDLEPKKPDNKFIVDGEDLNEKVDNCKSQ